MQNYHKRNKRFSWVGIVFFVWLIMNIRVAAGRGTTFERAVDGLVGIVLLVAVVFIALDFFQLIGKDKDQE